jgi:RNA polymerase II subunit A small phosphatase-like protein
MEKLYEVIIFTASISKYADPLMDILDKKNTCSYRLFRESCTMLSGFYVKELKRMNRNLKDVILLDV